MQSSLEADFVSAGAASFQTHLKFLHELENADHDEVAEADLEKEIQEIDIEMNKLKEEMETLDQERASLRAQRGSVFAELLKKRKLRDAMVDRVNQLTIENQAVHDHLNSLDEETNRVIANLDRYKQINAMNDAFYIWYAGPYATINSFRLGNLTNKPIEFTEINAALGQAALVVQVIALKAGVEFKHFLISPMGSFPKIIRGDDKKTSYPLFIDSSSFTLFPKRNFNLALQGFMSCILELGDYISNYDPTLSLPFKISVNDSKIGDLSFTYGNDDEIWTRALKFMLADIKWIIAWYTKHCSSNIVDGGSGISLSLKS